MYMINVGRCACYKILYMYNHRRPGRPELRLDVSNSRFKLQTQLKGTTLPRPDSELDSTEAVAADS